VLVTLGVRVDQQRVDTSDVQGALAAQIRAVIADRYPPRSLAKSRGSVRWASVRRPRGATNCGSRSAKMTRGQRRLPQKKRRTSICSCTAEFDIVLALD
jgi:hypothetical protein